MSKFDVAVIDYGVGNLLSVKRGLEYCGAKVNVTDDKDLIMSASRVVLPGVGAFSDGMDGLRDIIKSLSSVTFTFAPQYSSPRLTLSKLPTP
jgi:imidazoleglycerol phosphate synthase glutamine amidotransferase subunit HisH